MDKNHHSGSFVVGLKKFTILTFVVIFVLPIKMARVAEGRVGNTKLCERVTQQPLEELIGSLIEEISERSKCLVFAVDTYYRKLINLNKMRKTSIVPIYTIDVKDNEMFLPPNNQLGIVLRQSKADSCDAYIILIANGLQVSQFLEYTENERLINTRGSFLLIHDWRLFGRSMKRIWNRITNVVFIRRYNIVKNRSGERVSHERFNLDTFSYPVQGKKIVSTRYLDTWRNGKFRYGINHFSPKTRDLKKKALKVAVFQHIPAVTRAARKVFRRFMDDKISNQCETQTGGALGIEFELVKILEKKLNFVAKFYEPFGVEAARWGSRGQNYTYDGLLGEAVAGNAAFLIGDLYYTLGHDRLLDLSIPYNTECLTFLTPEALTDNSWKLLVVPFRLYTWIAVVFTLILGAYTFHFFALTYQKYVSFDGNEITKEVTCRTIQNFRPKIQKILAKKKNSVQRLEMFTKSGNSVLYTYSMLLQVSLPRIPSAWAVRVFIGWWWFYSILVTVSYRASMTATLANPVGRVTIDTIADLARSRIAVGGWNDEQRDLFLSSSDEDVRKIGKKFELTGNEDEAIARVANGTLCYYENIYVLRQARALRQELEYARMQNLSKEDKAPEPSDRDLHIMKECLIDMPVSLGMDKNSPLKPQVNRVIRRVIEAGFVTKWLSDVTEWSRIVEQRFKSPPAKSLVNLHKLHGAFVALAIGYILGFVALGTEILHWKYAVLRNPLYDKYHKDVYYANSKKC